MNQILSAQRLTADSAARLVLYIMSVQYPALLLCLYVYLVIFVHGLSTVGACICHVFYFSNLVSQSAMELIIFSSRLFRTWSLNLPCIDQRTATLWPLLYDRYFMTACMKVINISQCLPPSLSNYFLLAYFFQILARFSVIFILQWHNEIKLKALSWIRCIKF